jgi:hypothetical protein
MLPFLKRAASAARAALVLGAAQLGSAAAQPAPSTAAHLEVTADPGCVSRADLVARVKARSPRVSFVEDEQALDIRAQFSTDASGGVAGDVILASRGARPAPRHVRGRTCSEAADAVALIIAVTLDPSSLERARGTAPGDPANGPTAPGDQPGSSDKPSPRDAATASNRPGASNKRGSGDTLDKPITPPDEPNTKPPSGQGASFAAQVAAQALVGPAPGLMPGVAVYAELDFEQPGLWAPAVVVGGTHVARSAISEPGGVAAFSLDAASLDLCPLRLRFGRLAARPCGSLSGGRLSASGTETRNPADESHRPFWILGGAAILSSDVIGPLEASLRVAAGANLVRDSFTFTPQVFHTAAPVSIGASLGVGVRFR